MILVLYISLLYRQILLYKRFLGVKISIEKKIIFLFDLLQICFTSCVKRKYQHTILSSTSFFLKIETKTALVAKCLIILTSSRSINLLLVEQDTMDRQENSIRMPCRLVYTSYLLYIDQCVRPQALLTFLVSVLS